MAAHPNAASDSVSGAVAAAGKHTGTTLLSIAGANRQAFKSDSCIRFSNKRQTGNMMKKTIECLVLISTIFMGALWLATPSAQANEPATLTKSARDEFACPGMHAQWLDEHTVQCLRELP